MNEKSNELKKIKNAYKLKIFFKSHKYDNTMG